MAGLTLVDKTPPGLVPDWYREEAVGVLSRELGLLGVPWEARVSFLPAEPHMMTPGYAKPSPGSYWPPMPVLDAGCPVPHLRFPAWEGADWEAGHRSLWPVYAGGRGYRGSLRGLVAGVAGLHHKAGLSGTAAATLASRRVPASLVFLARSGRTLARRTLIHEAGHMLVLLLARRHGPGTEAWAAMEARNYGDPLLAGLGGTPAVSIYAAYNGHERAAETWLAHRLGMPLPAPEEAFVRRLLEWGRCGDGAYGATRGTGMAGVRPGGGRCWPAGAAGCGQGRATVDKVTRGEYGARAGTPADDGDGTMEGVFGWTAGTVLLCRRCGGSFPAGDELVDAADGTLACPHGDCVAGPMEWTARFWD